jgi:hypothetical protein
VLSPKVQAHVVICPEEVSVNVTASGTDPMMGVPVKLATDGGGVSLESRGTGPVGELAFVARGIIGGDCEVV